mgnify:FL=1
MSTNTKKDTRTERVRAAARAGSANYRKKNPDKVRETQRAYRQNNPEIVRGWNKEAQKRYYDKAKEDADYKERKYYSNLKSAFKKYAFTYASVEELEYFIEVVDKRTKGELVVAADRELASKRLDYPKGMKSRAFLFVRSRMLEKDYEQVRDMVKEAIEENKSAE